MIWIYAEQLFEELKKYNFIYVLFGNDSFLLQDSQSIIIKTISTLHDTENVSIELNINFDWNKIFNLCKTRNLFSVHKIISLKFDQDYPLEHLNKKIPVLISLIKQNQILILSIHTSYQITSYTTWIQSFKKNTVFVNCNTPKHKRLEIWIKAQSQHMQLVIENLACQILCYFYEGNISSLKQTLQYLSLIYPNGYLSFTRVKNVITDSAFFNINHWIESILTGNNQRANRVLKQLKYANINLKTLLNKIQREIIILIRIKYNMKQQESLYVLFKMYKIHTQYHRMILLQSIRRLSFTQLYQAMSLLIRMELKYHQNYMHLSQSDFELLTEILCGNNKIIPIYNIINTS